MGLLAIVAMDHELAETIAADLAYTGGTECKIVAADTIAAVDLGVADCVAYLPSLQKSCTIPDLVEATAVFRACDEVQVARFVLVSSAAVYGASFRNPGLLPESYPLSRDKSGIASYWADLEGVARKFFKQEGQLGILRCATLLSRHSASPIARHLTGSIVLTMPGHDPCIQVLSSHDLARAIGCLLQSDACGVFNVAPDGVIPWRQALRRLGIKTVIIPRTILLAEQVALTKSRAAHLEYQRYTWTISNVRIKELGFQPAKSSAQALNELRTASNAVSNFETHDFSHRFDDFGMDKAYIDSYGRTLFRFLADWYWRIETAGFEHIPRQGRGVLAGLHRGFMPFDGVMALHLIATQVGRYPRFLIHPGLVKFPFLANFMTKLGGIIACQKNAAYVLEREDLLGVFPEGIRGAFIRYSRAYQVQDFHRDAFVKIALRHRAPIIPFVTVGSAEIFPILGEIKSRWWSKYTEWPSLPITPTFPLVPLPLPSKWHMRFLPALHVERDYPPSAAENPAVVRAISRTVKHRMQEAIDEMLQRRRSVFFGSVFPAGTESEVATATAGVHLPQDSPTANSNPGTV
jgi:1-acyl-sn-glycerol-3-phosphate acyltransferase/nucleoside-diphosphate-sugar epimerase